MVKSPRCGHGNPYSNLVYGRFCFFPDNIYLDILYFDDYGKIHNNFFLIFVIDKKFIEK